MTGRIKLLKDGALLQAEADLPELGYDYDQPAAHDRACGTFGTHEFQLPHAECPEKFVCDVPADNAELAQFSNCIDSMNCAMMHGMTSSVKGSASEDALFLHQMIPHHQNAVNMAKALLKTGKVQCDDLTDEDSDQAEDCSLEIIIREIINTQNAQIQAMRGLLDSKSYPAENDCVVPVGGVFERALLDVSSWTADAFGAGDATAGDGEPCAATCTTDAASGEEVCRFTAKVNLFAGELGYYQFAECGDATNPVLGLEVGKTYQFVQKDPSNYYHPLGFAYLPDGAHADADELEPGIVPPDSSSACGADMSCPAPMYFVGDDYQGSYSNNPALASVTSGEDNFGLDDYEPLFFHPLPEWMGYGDFSVYLKFDEDTDFTKDIFYFCHIHQFMSGRIKLLKDGELLQKDAALPELGYEYDQPAEHDQVCGTYGVHEFQLPHSECPEQFVCDVPADNKELVQFSQCIDSMNCAMMSGMTASVQGSESEVALFLHQMIPHHQNAVNMAKALLKTGTVECDDLTDEESDQADDCALEIIAREIINNQNSQIQVMRGLLDSKSYPEENDCLVPMSAAVESSPASETEAVPDEETAGACYDMSVHQCFCTDANCDADKCTATGGIWTDQCPGEKCECKPGGDASEVVPDEETAEACYDMSVHQCSCTDANCDADKCTATGGVWTDQCPGEKCECKPGDITLPTAPTTEVELDVKEESTVSSEDKAPVVTDVETSAGTDSENGTTTKTPGEPSGVSKGIALAKLVATIFALNLCLINFGLQF